MKLTEQQQDEELDNDVRRLILQRRQREQLGFSYHVLQGRLSGNQNRKPVKVPPTKAP